MCLMFSLKKTQTINLSFSPKLEFLSVLPKVQMSTNALPYSLQLFFIIHILVRLNQMFCETLLEIKLHFKTFLRSFNMFYF